MGSRGSPQQRQGGAVGVTPAAGPGAPQGPAGGADHGHLGEGLVLEQAGGVLAVVAGPLHHVVGVAVHPVLGVAGRPGGLASSAALSTRFSSVS